MNPPFRQEKQRKPLIFSGFFVLLILNNALKQAWIDIGSAAFRQHLYSLLAQIIEATASFFSSIKNMLQKI